MSLEQLQKAVKSAANSDCVLDFTRQETYPAGTLIRQLHVNYKSGNEYLSLDNLLHNLSQIGEVAVFEFRGRGREGMETPRIVVDVKVDTDTYQLLYHLPHTER